MEWRWAWTSRKTTEDPMYVGDAPMITSVWFFREQMVCRTIVLSCRRRGGRKEPYSRRDTQERNIVVRSSEGVITSNNVFSWESSPNHYSIWRRKKVVVWSSEVLLLHSIFGHRKNNLNYNRMCRHTKAATRTCEVGLLSQQLLFFSFLLSHYCCSQQK
jgi:hypothetical protein